MLETREWGGAAAGEWPAERSSQHSEGLLPSVRSPALEVTRCPPTLQGAVEPMQIDVDPQEDPQNTPDVNYVVENPTLVRACGALLGSPGGVWGLLGVQARLLTLAVSFCDPETSRVSNCPLMKGLCTHFSLPGGACVPGHPAGCLTVRTGLP